MLNPVFILRSVINPYLAKIVSTTTTYSFTKPKCHITFKVSEMHPFVRTYEIFGKEAYFLREN